MKHKIQKLGKIDNWKIKKIYTTQSKTVPPVNYFLPQNNYLIRFLPLLLLKIRLYSDLNSCKQIFGQTSRALGFVHGNTNY